LFQQGLPCRYSVFSHISSIDTSSRNHGHAVTPSELATLCAAAPKATLLNLNGAYQIASLSPLNTMQAMTHLALNHTAITDTDLVAVLPNLNHSLISLSLRECIFLKGDFISTLKSATNLRRLDVSNIGLALHTNPATGRALSTLSSLEILSIGGNTVCDTTAGNISSLPRLKGLSLKDSHTMSEAGLEELAAGPAGRVLEILDLEGCQGVGEGCWAALSRLKVLKELSLARMPHLLQAAPMPDFAAAALWRWPSSLRKLCIAGSNVHPTKLKLLAAACGPCLLELDLSVPNNNLSSSSSSPSRPPFARLTPQQVRDLVEAARCLKQLKVLNVARTGMPLEAAVAFLRAAPRLTSLYLSGCSLGPRIGLGAQGGSRATAGQLWSSGIFIPGSVIPYRAEVVDVSNSLAAPGPDEFALALGALTALRMLSLDDSGLRAEHVRHVHWLKGLVNVNFAGNRGIGDVVAKGLAASGSFLEEINLSGTSLTDEGLKCLQGGGAGGDNENSGRLNRLHTLSIARSGSGITLAGLQALVVKRGGASGAACSPPLRSLNLSDCVSIDTEYAEFISTSFPKLTHLNLSGCVGLKATGVEKALPALSLLRNLDISRCGDALTDTGLDKICEHLSQLTGLKLDGARKLTGEGLTALSTLSVLSELDLTCCAGLGDDDEDVKRKLPEDIIATVQLPQGGRATVSSPLVKMSHMRSLESLAGVLPQV
jgi:Leucine Rich repeat